MSHSVYNSSVTKIKGTKTVRPQEIQDASAKQDYPSYIARKKVGEPWGLEKRDDVAIATMAGQCFMDQPKNQPKKPTLTGT